DVPSGCGSCAPAGERVGGRAGRPPPVPRGRRGLDRRHRRGPTRPMGRPRSRRDTGPGHTATRETAAQAHEDEARSDPNRAGTARPGAAPGGEAGERMSGATGSGGTRSGATEVTTCRSCGGERPRPFLSLGATPVANRLVRADALDVIDPAFPLGVGFCERCALVQLTHVLPADEIFDADYPYFSSFSDMLVRHSEKNVIELIESRDLGPDSLVVEVASNDGYLLRAFVERGIPVLGIEPTPGPAAAAREVGVPTR